MGWSGVVGGGSFLASRCREETLRQRVIVIGWSSDAGRMPNQCVVTCLYRVRARVAAPGSVGIGPTLIQNGRCHL